ncbi:sugar-binding protein [Nonomuraea phyllanthi]|uniref:Sugar-binding protein n=1 Tax=Nonomuraea phyllanthi TaxID=2219224 RepID=A0A5C4VK35_9ACTN|nr:polymorphic toxin-type HINT domain-containing protein [Nonomuraea phyllanthi]KAB8189125.1 sugar-binding protein [Nonomuraea phyllanthi]
MKHSSLFRRAAAAMSVVVVTSLIQGAALPSGERRSAEAERDRPVAGKVLRAKPRPVPKEPATPRNRPRSAWPQEKKALVTPPAAGARAAAAAPGTPLTLTMKGTAAVGEVEVAVLPRKAALKTGAGGPVFTLRSTAGAEGAVGAGLDYSDFAGLYGGAYASRLTLVELPACALSTPDAPECRTATPLKTVNDAERRTLSVDEVKLRGGTPTVLAAVAGTSGASGDYKATPLSPSSTWQVNLNTGDFAWSYGIPVPEVPGGLAPDVELGYSSGAVDGRTANTNNQSSWIGDGFDLWPGYIERSYKSCADDGVENADGMKPGDLCWAYDNAFVSFNGQGGELVPAGENTWKFRADDGSKIERIQGDNGDVRGNGARKDEYWLITAPNGVKYYFGYNRLPGWSSGKETTDSVWTVPVFGDDTGEDCHGDTFTESWCRQAWRWNLDYVVDPRGNAIAYFYDKETNSYGRNLKATDNTRYVRGGTLDRIEYGLDEDAMYTTPALAKVDFTSGERCLPDSLTTCASIETDAAYWYDTPWDLNCGEGEDCDDGRLSPSFFTRKRLTSITTYAGGSKVDSFKLAHRWGQADVDYQLLLDSIQRTGHTGSTAITMPKVTLAYTQLANRLDKTGDGYPPFIKSRLSSVADEYGGQIDAQYSAPACAWDKLPTPHTNTTRCFPQFYGGSITDPPTQQWFNKYVVTSVTTTDRTGGAPDQVLRYEYLGDAAWHYDDDNGLTEEKRKTWSQWRGYQHVRVLTTASQTDTYFLRGMHGDKAAPEGDATKDVSVSLSEGEGQPIVDHEALAGATYKTVQFSGPGGKVLSKSVTRPWRHQTATRTRPWGTITANLTGAAQSRTWTSLDDGTGARWRTTTVKNTYETVAGRIVAIDDLGDDATAADDKCTRTTYATDALGKNLTLPSRVEVAARTCAAAPERPGDVITDVRTAYDGGTYGAAPTAGAATATATLKEYQDTTAVYLESGSTYDDYGRVLTSTDLTATVKIAANGAITRTARTDGRTTTTTRTPATGFVTTTKVTGPPAEPGDPATAQTATTTHDVTRGQVLTTTDTNGKVTNLAYDALGRLTKVWLPDRLTGQTPTYAFSYRITENDAVAVGSTSTGLNGTTQTSYTLYDGLLRPRQVQEPGPDGGRLITDTFYNERGLEAIEFTSYFTTGLPRTGLFQPDDALSVETQTHHSYDGLGRETRTALVAGNSTGGKTVSTTTTIYGGDRVTVIPPAGATATTTVTDARGRTVALHQHHQRSAASAADITTYAYNPAGKLKKITDPDGNDWIYEYDLLGRQVVSQDPDKGRSISTYDDRGQLTSTQDARKAVLQYVYDGLGRKTQLRDKSGTVLASWEYDTIPGAKGQLAKSIRHVGGHAYVQEVNTYDRLYRVTSSSVVIPDAEGALKGTYTFKTSYEDAGMVKGLGLPAAGALPAATVAFAYQDKTLWPAVVNGLGVTATTGYFHTGDPSEIVMSRSGGKTTTVGYSYEWGTQRLAVSSVDTEDVPGTDRSATYRYDEAGNILAVADVSRDGTDTQCFAYDYLRRLTEAWTPATCAGTPSGAALTGPAAYWHSYTYDKVGNRHTETQHHPSGDAAKDITRTYTYPAAGGDRPHALTSVTAEGPSGTTTDTYDYDAAGNTTSRPGQVLEWDAEGHLAKVAEGDTVTEYLYDADGSRLIGRTPTGTTLYLGGTEVVLAKNSTTPKATRYLDLGGGHQAVQSDNGAITFTIADHLGTGQIALDSATQKLSQRRMLPFGGPRGPQINGWPGTRGFVGGIDDTQTTGLTHLGAREYDPSTGRFISVDPILDVQNPQQYQGYAYSGNNPITFSDPTGLLFDFGSWFDRAVKGAASAARSTATTIANQSGYVPGGQKPHVDQVSVQDATVIEGVRIPTNTELVSMAPHLYKEETPEWANQRLWARRQCATSERDGGLGGSSFCSQVLHMRWNEMPQPQQDHNHSLLKGIVKAIWPVDDIASCKTGKGKSCAATLVSIAPWGKLAKRLKVLKGGKKATGARSATKCVNSFAPDTPVLMADGTREEIEDIEVGDKVLATDPETGETSAEKVTALHRNRDTELADVTIRTAGGKALTIRTTQHHPFWNATSKKWVDAADLHAGESLQAPGGDQVKIAAVRVFDGARYMHNLTVGDLHTYYVEAGDQPVLVHNSDRCDIFSAPSISVDRHGRLTNGRYTLDSTGMDPHINGTPGKSQFGFHVNSGKAVLDAAAYADRFGLWVGPKAKVPVSNGVIGYLGDGTPTTWVNVYRNKNGFIHGSPGSPR